MTPPERSKSSPLSGRYLVRNRAWNAALRVTDAVLARVAQAARGAAPDAPSRILVAVGGHLGDAVIATTVLPMLARAYPTASIGMLLPSWSRVVIDGHPRVRWMHHADHWKTSRAGVRAGAKWSAYRASAASAIEEIAAIRYDLAIDLYAYYPNAAWLLWRAGIPVRVGYTSGGCGPLYTHAVDWTTDLGHTAEQHARLLGEVAPHVSDDGSPREDRVPLRYDLPPIAGDVRARARALLQFENYIAIHPGTGDARKAWPLEQWRDLIERLSVAGAHIVLTGAGDAEEQIAASLSAGRESVQNLVGQLDWPIFRAVLANAKLAIGPDSVAMHVAAAEGTPAVAIMAAMSDPEYWKPRGPRVEALTRPVNCAPCYQKAGCEAMTCVRDVTVDEVLAACARLGAIARPALRAEMPVG